MTLNKKYQPQIGEELYLQQQTGSYYVDMVKTPYTVIAAGTRGVKIQAAQCIYPVFKYQHTMDPYYQQFDGRRVQFYNTLPERIEADPDGEIIELHWSAKRQAWQYASYPGDPYPKLAHFGEGYQYFPYLD